LICECGFTIDVIYADDGNKQLALTRTAPVEGAAGYPCLSFRRETKAPWAEKNEAQRKTRKSFVDGGTSKTIDVDFDVVTSLSEVRM